MTRADYNNLIDSFSDRLFRYALKLTRDYNWSQDLVQESLEKLWVNKTKVAIDHAQAFLYKVLYNKMVDDIRKHKRIHLTETLPEKTATPSLQLEHKDMIEKAFAQLDERQRQIIMLRDWQGYNYKEIGEIMEYSDSLVKVLLFRARKKMRAVMNELNNTHSTYNENQ